MTATATTNKLNIETSPPLIGIWTLTSFDNPTAFTDTWEFKANGIFNELKYVNDGDKKMSPDENGSWQLRADTLIMTVIQEYHNGILVKYEKPSIAHFLVEQIEQDYKLTLLYNSYESHRKESAIAVFRLAK